MYNTFHPALPASCLYPNVLMLQTQQLRALLGQHSSPGIAVVTSAMGRPIVKGNNCVLHWLF